MEIEHKIQVEFDLPEDKSVNIIKVIGVGGGGGNAVKNMYKQGVENVSFAICNTDSQALARTDVPVRIQLGKEGLGVGGNPQKGKEAAEESLDVIGKLFEDDTQMVFITAGMGGGTGTGAGPVIAGIAKERGLLTVGVVTVPFSFEKRTRILKALQGVEEMRKNVDALLVINNERLRDIYADGITTVEQAFERADDILTVATRSIAEIITLEGIVNRDFCDVKTVMKDGGNAIMSVGRGSGEHRIEKAILNALDSPLLNNVDIERARKLLYIIYSCDEKPVVISELSEVNDFMDNLSADIEVLWGLYRDNTLGDEVKVTIIATGFDGAEEQARDVPEDNREAAHYKDLMKFYYGEKDSRKSLRTVGKRESVEELQETEEAEKPERAGTEHLDQGQLEQPKAKFSLMEQLRRKLGEYMEEVM